MYLVHAKQMMSLCVSMCYLLTVMAGCVCVCLCVFMCISFSLSAMGCCVSVVVCGRHTAPSLQETFSGRPSSASGTALSTPQSTPPTPSESWSSQGPAGDTAMWVTHTCKSMHIATYAHTCVHTLAHMQAHTHSCKGKLTHTHNTGVLGLASGPCWWPHGGRCVYSAVSRTQSISPGYY